MQGFRKRFWAEIDMDAARENLLAVRGTLPPAVKLCCVVKANAYGHGALPLSRLYERLGVSHFAVSNVEEAMQLRLGGIDGEILILGYTPPDCAALLCAHRLVQTVFSLEYAKALEREAEAADVRLVVHSKLDSGMGRLGFRCDSETLAEEMEALSQMPHLSVEGVFTHFAMADSGDWGKRYTDLQYRAFEAALGRLAERGIRFSQRHCANSAAILDYPEYRMSMVRAGVLLYGALPSLAVKHTVPLRLVMSLRAVISMVKTLREGESVSYGCTFRAPREMRVATVPVGYADGYWRSNAENGGYLLVRGKRAPIVGRICMDQLMLDVTEIPEAAMGDVATIIGVDGEECITVEMLAERNGTIPYEILCSVGERVPRFYLENGRIVGVKDNIIGE